MNEEIKHDILYYLFVLSSGLFFVIRLLIYLLHYFFSHVLPYQITGIIYTILQLHIESSFFSFIVSIYGLKEMPRVIKVHEGFIIEIISPKCALAHEGLFISIIKSKWNLITQGIFVRELKDDKTKKR